MSDDDQLKKVPLHGRHVALGARMVPFAGYSMPVKYRSIKEEHRAVRRGAGLFDVSHMGRIEARGPDAVAAVDRLMTNDLSRLSDGRALYTVMCNDEGGIIDDLVIYRRTEQRLLLCVNAANRDRDRSHLRERLEGDVELVDRSDDTIQLALQGPDSNDVLRQVATVEPESIGFFRCASAGVAGVNTLVARTGYTGEDGFELYCPADQGETVFDALLACDDPDVIACGLGCRDTLRLEAGLLLHGQDIDESTNPLEAGLSWLVKFDADRDFVGRRALKMVQQEGVERRLKGFVLQDRGVLRPGYRIEVDGTPAGELTSGGYAPTLEASIGLGYIDIGYGDAREVDVLVRDRALRATVVDPPFVERSK